ncbi:MAG: transposase [Planctomycetaceae bacterium]|nr:transposase [Planctomycetaceae bacterium]
MPALHAGDAVVLDNLKPHLAPRVTASIAGADVWVLPLPPYSPDDTPIEKMFSKVKQWLRRAEARTRAGLCDTLGEAPRRVTLQDILGWFRHAGLCATHG